LKTHFENLFEFAEELLILGGIGNVDEGANQLIAKRLPCVFSNAANDLRFRRHRAESRAQF
jgi:hypothetical protein